MEGVTYLLNQVLLIIWLQKFFRDSHTKENQLIFFHQQLFFLLWQHSIHHLILLYLRINITDFLQQVELMFFGKYIVKTKMLENHFLVKISKILFRVCFNLIHYIDQQLQKSWVILGCKNQFHKLKVSNKNFFKEIKKIRKIFWLIKY